VPTSCASACTPTTPASALGTSGLLCHRHNPGAPNACITIGSASPPSRNTARLDTEFVWPDHSKAEQGEYDLTFAPARPSLADRAGLLPDYTVEVIVVRDPDRSNDYTVVDGAIRPHTTTGRAAGHVRVITHDIDLGAQDITAAWVAAQLESARRLSPAAATHAGEVIAGYADDNDGDVA
jgi:hypothetical protein